MVVLAVVSSYIIFPKSRPSPRSFTVPYRHSWAAPSLEGLVFGGEAYKVYSTLLRPDKIEPIFGNLASLLVRPTRLYQHHAGKYVFVQHMDVFRGPCKTWLYFEDHAMTSGRVFEI